jgi:hypothetical protein
VVPAASPTIQTGNLAVYDGGRPDLREDRNLPRRQAVVRGIGKGGDVSRGLISYPPFTLTSQSTSMYTTSQRLSGILMGTM